MAREIITDDGDRVLMNETTYASTYSPLARFIWFVLGVINTLLALRFLLRLFSANPTAPFTDFIYSLSAPLVAPFAGVIRSNVVEGTGVIEWSTILAIVIYWLVAWAIVRLFTLGRPVMRY